MVEHLVELEKLVNEEREKVKGEKVAKKIFSC